MPLTNRFKKRFPRHLFRILLLVFSVCVFVCFYVTKQEEKYLPEYLVSNHGQVYLLHRNQYLYLWDGANQKQNCQAKLKSNSEIFYDEKMIYYSRGRHIIGFDLGKQAPTVLFTADSHFKSLTLLGVTKEQYIALLFSSSNEPMGMLIDRESHATRMIDLPDKISPIRHEVSSGPRYFLQANPSLTESSIIAINLINGQLCETQLTASISSGIFLDNLGCFVSLKEEAADPVPYAWAFVGLNGASTMLPLLGPTALPPELFAPVDGAKMLIVYHAKNRTASFVYLYDAASGEKQYLFKARNQIHGLVYDNGKIVYIDCPIGSYESWRVHTVSMEQGSCF